MRAIRVPSLAAGLWRNCPKDGPQEVGQFDASPWMDCRRTPEQAREPGAQGLCVRRECWVAFLLVTFLTPGFLPSALRASFAVRAAPAAQWPLKEK